VASNNILAVILAVFGVANALLELNHKLAVEANGVISNGMRDPLDLHFQAVVPLREVVLHLLEAYPVRAHLCFDLLILVSIPLKKGEDSDDLVLLGPVGIHSSVIVVYLQERLTCLTFLDREEVMMLLSIITDV
jgi:hypothetical protein